MVKINAGDKFLLSIINKKPYKLYSFSQLFPHLEKRSYSLAEEEAKDENAQLNRLIELGLIRAGTFYYSPDADI